jgi:hypothetical protein
MLNFRDLPPEFIIKTNA